MIELNHSTRKFVRLIEVPDFGNNEKKNVIAVLILFNLNESLYLAAREKCFGQLHNESLKCLDLYLLRLG